MAKFGRITPQPLCLQPFKPIRLIKRSISFLTLQQNSIYLQHSKSCYVNCKTKRILPSTGQHTIHNYDFSSYMSDDDIENKKYKVVKNYSFQVPSFGGIISANTPADITIRSADPTQHHNLDHACVRLLSSEKSDVYSAKLKTIQEGHKLSVQCTLEKGATISDYKVDVEVPIVHNVKVSALHDASVDVYEFIESNYVNIRAECGEVKTQQIKTENLSIHTVSGDVLCQGSLQGDIKITSIDGNIISSKRFMGPNVEVETENGDIRVASSYSDQAKFSTSKGCMNLRNIHNESYVAVYDEGDVKMQGLDGSTNIFIKKGDLDVHISRIRNESRIHVEDGNIHLKLSDSYPLKLSVDANEIVTDAKCGEHGKVEKKLDSDHQHFFSAIEPNKFSPTLVVVADNGSVEIEMQDWATSFGVKLCS